MTIATDIICGFPTETERDFDETLDLCGKYRFPSLFINQFFPRPGTPAAHMSKIPTQEVKLRTKKLTDLFYSYQPYDNKIGEIHDVLVTEISHDKKYYVGHNKYYEQVLIPMKLEYMGKLVKVKITNATKFSMVGCPLENEVLMPGLTKPLAKGEVSGVKMVDRLDKKMIIAFVIIFFSVFIRILWFYSK